MNLILAVLAMMSTFAAAPPPAERVIKTAYLTGYSYYDNTPPGSATIAYPNAQHKVAGGTGSYANPITVAVGWHRRNGPLWAPGSRFYIPFLRKYVRVEDQCGDHAQYGPCYQLGQADRGATTWLDVWVDGRGYTRRDSERCMNTITRIHTVVYRPRADYRVHKGSITGACRAGRFFSETPTRA
jgi:hypothetical protein